MDDKKPKRTLSPEASVVQDSAIPKVSKRFAPTSDNTASEISFLERISNKNASNMFSHQGTREDYDLVNNITIDDLEDKKEDVLSLVTIEETHSGRNRIATTMNELRKDLSQGLNVCINLEFMVSGITPAMKPYCNDNFEIEGIEGFDLLTARMAEDREVCLRNMILSLNQLELAVFNEDEYKKEFFHYLCTEASYLYYKALAALKREFPEQLTIKIAQHHVDMNKPAYQYDPSARRYVGRDCAMAASIIESMRNVSVEDGNRVVPTYDRVYFQAGSMHRLASLMVAEFLDSENKKVELVNISAALPLTDESKDKYREEAKIIGDEAFKNMEKIIYQEPGWDDIPNPEHNGRQRIEKLRRRHRSTPWPYFIYLKHKDIYERYAEEFLQTEPRKLGNPPQDIQLLKDAIIEHAPNMSSKEVDKLANIAIRMFDLDYLIEDRLRQYQKAGIMRHNSSTHKEPSECKEYGEFLTNVRNSELTSKANRMSKLTPKPNQASTSNQVPTGNFTANLANQTTNITADKTLPSISSFSGSRANT